MSQNIVNNNILVVGGAGYIGSHTCLALSERGYNPIVVDSLVTGFKSAVQWGSFHQVDLHSTAQLTEILVATRPVAVIHFAAFAYVGESVQNPLKYYQNNVVGTLSLLQAMKSAGVKNLIFSSTCATYGTPEKTPISEDTAQKPVNPYGHSKLMVEQILKDLASRDEIKAMCLRYFNASGADPEGRIGESHNPETHLIPLALQASSAGPELILFGTDYPTPDGSCIRDYIHVLDLAEAHILGFETLLKSEGPNFQALNLGTGQGISNLQVIHGIQEVTGRAVKYRTGARRPGDPPSLVADGRKALQVLGWKPKYSDLKTIIKHADQWHLKTWKK